MSAAKWLPLVSTRAAAVLEEMGWVEDRDFWVTPDMPMADARADALASATAGDGGHGRRSQAVTTTGRDPA